jgi:hypothetical protein
MKQLTTVLLFLIGACALHARDDEQRRLIELDRRDISFSSQEAFEKSREYIRKDSTYYIGWMYMGAYLFNRANDEKGFTQAIEPLKKAFELIEKDYDGQLRTRTNDLMGYINVQMVQNDYSYIANWLSGAYQNIEKAQEAYDVLIHVKDRDLQYEAAVESWNTLAWLYHRNRMYTTEKFPFLKNSVHENDSMAYACLDSAIAKTQRDNEINQGLFDPTFMASRYYFTYHYKVILFTYDFELDSADYYYNILLESGYYSSNNYGNYMYMKGEFSLAEQFYKEAEDRDNTTDKHTREYFYMRGLLEINRATPDRADSLLSTVINADGVTPGYGWHNIALARALMYEGLTTISQRKLNIAARFEELHIGTTWGKEQYNLSVATLNYINALHFESEYFFENNQWYFWLNPVNWYKAIEFKMRVHHFRLVMVSLVAANPERAEVIYPLFSSENLLGWDETCQMLDGFSNPYFIRVYKDMLENDPRPGIKNYIKYTLARLYISEGEESTAREYLNEIAGELSTGVRMEFDNMLYARTCESLAQISEGDDRQQWLREAYNTFPQLIPYSNEQLNFRVNIDSERYHPGAQDTLYKFSIFALIGVVALLGLYHWARRYFRLRHSAKWINRTGGTIALMCIAIILWNVFGRDQLSTKEQIVASMADCNIGFTDESSAPEASFTFSESDSLMTGDYEVYDGNDREVNKGSFTVDKDKPEQAGVVLAYRLFKIDFTYNSADVNAEEVEETTPAAEPSAK